MDWHTQLKLRKNLVFWTICFGWFSCRRFPVAGVITVAGSILACVWCFPQALNPESFYKMGEGLISLIPSGGGPSSQLLPLRLSAFLFSDHSSKLDVLQIKNAAPPEVEQYLSCGEGGINFIDPFRGYQQKNAVASFYFALSFFVPCLYKLCS